VKVTMAVKTSASHNIKEEWGGMRGEKVKTNKNIKKKKYNKTGKSFNKQSHHATFLFIHPPSSLQDGALLLPFWRLHGAQDCTDGLVEYILETLLCKS